MESIDVNILTSIPLLFVIALCLKRDTAEHVKTRFFLYACIVMVIISLLDCVEAVFTDVPTTAAYLIVLVCTAFEYALMPFISLSLIFEIIPVDREHKVWKCLLAIVVIYFFCCVACIGWGLIACVDGIVVVASGFRLIEIVFNVGLAVTWLVLQMIEAHRYIKEDQRYAVYMVGLVICGIVIQEIWNNIHIMWAAISLGLILKYILMKDRQLRYDVLTGIQNRLMFQRKMVSCQAHRYPCTIISVDVNFLKRVNDIQGHAAGDQLLVDVADALQQRFYRYGIPYRIGGDEFCVICSRIRNMELSYILELLDKEIVPLAEKYGVSQVLAYGFCHFERTDTDIYEALKEADRLMYEHKRQIKDAIRCELCD